MENITVALIPRIGNKFLFIKKYHYDNKFACIAGHAKENEKLEEAAEREVKEEAGIKIKNLKLVFNKKLQYTCRYGHDWHDLFLFEAESDQRGIFKSDEGETVLMAPEDMGNVLWLETTRNFLTEAGYLKN